MTAAPAQAVACTRCDQPAAAHATPANRCPRFVPRLLTNVGLAQATAILHAGRGERFDDDKVTEWRRKLGGFTDEDVFAACEELEEASSDPRQPGGRVNGGRRVPGRDTRPESACGRGGRAPPPPAT